MPIFSKELKRLFQRSTKLTAFSYKTKKTKQMMRSMQLMTISLNNKTLNSSTVTSWRGISRKNNAELRQLASIFKPTLLSSSNLNFSNFWGDKSATFKSYNICTTTAKLEISTFCRSPSLWTTFCSCYKTARWTNMSFFYFTMAFLCQFPMPPLRSGLGQSWKAVTGSISRALTATEKLIFRSW